MDAAYVQRLQRHLHRFWPDHRCEPLMWTLGDWPREHPEFRVLELAPPGPDEHWVYVSAGAAHLRRFGGVGHEYVIRTRRQERLTVELLAMVASYSAREDDSGLHDGHTVPIGYPWVEGAAADHLYVRIITSSPRTRPGHRASDADMILPKIRDSRFVTIRRGGTLTDPDHHLLALWAASCAEHVLELFESAQPEDPRPREAIEHARAWVRGEVKMTEARRAAGRAMAAARDLRGAPRHAAYAAGQAGVVAHVAAHELGAAAYAIKAARAAAPEGEGDDAGRLECRWQRDQLPEAIRELVLDDQRLRNDICWSVFDC